MYHLQTPLSNLLIRNHEHTNKSHMGDKHQKCTTSNHDGVLHTSKYYLTYFWWTNKRVQDQTTLMSLFYRKNQLETCNF